jgi:hypothetical protein
VATQAERRDDARPKKKKRKPGASPFGGGIPIALIGLAATGIGFFPTFFSRLSQVDAPHLVHGWIMIAWLALVLTQALLITQRQYRWHRILGWSSVALFVAMVVTSWQMIVLMLSGGNRLPFEAAKFFAYTDLVDMPLLLILYGGAIYWRKDRHLHSRLVSATVLTSIVPALARMFNVLIWRSLDGLFTAMHPTYIFILGVLTVAIWVDWKNQRLRWPLPFVFAWFVVDYATLWPVWHSQWYDGLARSIATLA